MRYSGEPAGAESPWAAPPSRRSGLAVLPLGSERLRRATLSLASRNVPATAMATLVTNRLVPQAGDLVLVRVDHAPGLRGTTVLAYDPWGNPHPVGLHRGDEAVLCYGESTDEDSSHSVLPPTLSPCVIVSAEGVAGFSSESSSALNSVTRVTPLGFIGDSGAQVINLRAWDRSRSEDSAVAAI